MPKFNPQEAARLQAIVDADPAIQAAIAAYQAEFFVPNPNANKAARDAAQRRLTEALNNNPVLRAAQVGERTVREGYELNPRAQRGRGLITKEGSDVGHIVRDIILPAAGAGAIVAAPAIIGSQAAAGGGSAGSSAAPAGSAVQSGAQINALLDTLGGGTSTMAGAGSIAGPTTLQTLQGAGYAGGGGFSGLGSILNPRTIGAGVGAISQGQAQNRGEEFGGQLDLARAQIEREQENRMGGLDAWRRLLMAQRTLSPGPRPQLSPYSVKPRQATADELSGANAMTREVMARLQGGPSQMQVDPRLLKPGRGERFLGYAAPVLEGVGRALGY